MFFLQLCGTTFFLSFQLSMRCTTFLPKWSVGFQFIIERQISISILNSLSQRALIIAHYFCIFFLSLGHFGEINPYNPSFICTYLLF